MKYAVIASEDGGYQTHTGDVENLRLPDSAEIYDDRGAYEDRLVELDSD